MSPLPLFGPGGTGGGTVYVYELCVMVDAGVFSVVVSQVLLVAGACL